MKKKLQPIILLIVLGWTLSTNAMLVTIPDDNFRAYLQSSFPSSFVNGQMETTSDEIIKETGLHLEKRNIKDLTGIEYFVNLTYLDCSGNQLTSLPKLPGSLLLLDCANNTLTSLPVLPSGLKVLSTRSNPIISLPVLPDSLEALLINNIGLVSLGSLPQNLKDLDCSGNKLTTLPALPANLKALLCSDNQLSSLPDFPSTLTSLKCNDNTLDFADLEKISTSAKNSYFNLDLVISPNTQSIDLNTTLTINGLVGGTQNKYKWFYNDLLIVDATSAVYTKPNVSLTDQGVYKCEVTSTLFNGSYINSNEVTVTVKNTLAVSNPDESLFLTQVYPNPSNGEFIIELPENQKQDVTEVIIYNALGQKIISNTQSNKKFTLNLASQPSGAYFVHLINADNHITKKIIKN